MKPGPFKRYRFHVTLLTVSLLAVAVSCGGKSGESDSKNPMDEIYALKAQVLADVEKAQKIDLGTLRKVEFHCSGLGLSEWTHWYDEKTGHYVHLKMKFNTEEGCVRRRVWFTDGLPRLEEWIIEEKNHRWVNYYYNDAVFLTESDEKNNASVDAVQRYNVCYSLPKREWTKAEKENVKVEAYGEQDKSQVMAELAWNFEMEYLKFFGVQKSDGVQPVRIKLFHHRSEMEVYIRESGKQDILLTGYFDPKKWEIVTFKKWMEIHVPEIIVHEMTHYLNRRELGEMDVWLEEGLAVWMASHYYLKNILRTTSANRLASQQAILAWALEHGSVPSLVKFLSLAEDEFYAPGQIKVNYALAALTVGLLINAAGPKSPSLLREYVDTVGNSSHAPNRPAIFRKVFGLSTADADAKIRLLCGKD
jgi:hypothetical protein